MASISQKFFSREEFLRIEPFQQRLRAFMWRREGAETTDWLQWRLSLVQDFYTKIKTQRGNLWGELLGEILELGLEKGVRPVKV